jgi:hypothetical protein
VSTARKQRELFRSLPKCLGGAHIEIKAWFFRSFCSFWENNNFVSPKEDDGIIAEKITEYH